LPADPEARKRNARGELLFDDQPDFRPRLTPRQVIAAGSWGGVYFNPRGGKPGIWGRECAIDHKEFPASWFAGVDESLYLARRYDAANNKYGVKAGADQAAWESSGWIRRDLDPRGWFQWCACSLSLWLRLKAWGFELVCSVFLLPDFSSAGTAAFTSAAAATTTRARSRAGRAWPARRAAGSARC